MPERQGMSLLLLEDMGNILWNMVDMYVFSSYSRRYPLHPLHPRYLLLPVPDLRI